MLEIVQEYLQEIPLIPIHEKILSGEKTFFDTTFKEALAKRILPKHIAIIPDGNRRWAKSVGQSTAYGYTKGAHSLVQTALAAKELGISWMTIYSFSTENWQRPKAETDILMALIEKHLLFYEASMIQAKISIQTIGNLARLPISLQRTLDKVVSSTFQKQPEFTLVLAINYGGRDEIVRAVEKISQTFTSLTHITEDLISQALDTAKIPDPDLIIRAGGEKRLSNFLLWQSSYSEVYIEENHWPDYRPEDLYHAIIDFQTRQRRMGGF